MKTPYDVIAIGDATMDMFLGLNTAGSRACKLDKTECVLQLSYADKIEADYQEFATGGNSANLAVGAARLGLRTAFYTVLGQDEIGDVLQHAIEREGVSPEYILRQKGPTNFHVALTHQGERTIIIYHNKRVYKLPKLKPSAWVYYSSMGDGFERLHPALIKHVKANKVKLGFNPGTIQLKAGLKRLQPILDVTEVLIVNEEEAHRLLGLKHDGIDFKALLTKLYQAGPRQVVVTDGPNGAYAYDGRTFWFMPVFEVPVIERTGAGDSFSTGVVSALAKGNPLSEALRWGAFNSASVIQQVGPQKGLLKLAVMQKFLRNHKELQARMI
ncbi:MAG: carbohydrate kinase family protein [Parcubacteria group bacterium]|nr:carbohydrate kinase family protein [Parcubacteria group bacterium]